LRIGFDFDQCLLVETEAIIGDAEFTVSIELEQVNTSYIVLFFSQAPMTINEILRSNVLEVAGPNQNEAAGLVVQRAGQILLRRPAQKYDGATSEHAELRLVRGIEDQISRAIVSTPVPTGAHAADTELQLYTYKSPCELCTILLNLFREHFMQQILHWRLAWSEHWIPPNLPMELTRARNAMKGSQSEVNTNRKVVCDAQQRTFQLKNHVSGVSKMSSNRFALCRAPGNYEACQERARRSLLLAERKRAAFDKEVSAAEERINEHLRCQGRNLTALSEKGWIVEKI